MDLRTIRFLKRITQWDMAIATGICQSKVSLIERGFVIPNDEEKVLIVAALEINENEIEWPKGAGASNSIKSGDGVGTSPRTP